MCSFATAPPAFSAGRAVTLGDARDGVLPDPIMMRFHLFRGHASAQQIKRAQVDSEVDNLHLSPHVDDVLKHCEIRWAFDRAPQVTIAATCTVSMLQNELPSLDDILALRVTDVFPDKSSPTPVRSRNPREVWDVPAGLRIGIFGSPVRF